MERSIHQLIKEANDARIYIYCRTEGISQRFLEDAECQGITFGDGMIPTERHATDVYRLYEEHTISYVGYSGHLQFNISSAPKERLFRVDYEKYLHGEPDYLITEANR